MKAGVPVCLLVALLAATAQEPAVPPGNEQL